VTAAKARLEARAAAQAVRSLTIADLPASGQHDVTNRLYSTNGLQVNGLIWYWQAPEAGPLTEWIRLSADDARMQLAFQGDAIGLDATAPEWRSYAGDTRLIAWTAHHEPILELVRALFQRDWLPDDMALREAARRTPCVRTGFSVHRMDGLRVATGVAVFPASFVTGLIQAGGTAPRLMSRLQHVPAALRILLDEVDMDAAELAALTRHSVVRLDNRTLATDRARVALTAGRMRLIADVSDRHATVVGTALATLPIDAITNGGTRMTDASSMGGNLPQQKPTTDGAQHVEVGALPVRLSFSAGGVVIAYDALRRLAPGFVFELAKRLDDQAITICANDIPIAVGELVAVGDLIGVRVTRMLPVA
jgi:flagellar motor switch/type III secretory pathway protein FliN